MRIAYIVNARMPTERAHGTQTARMCEAFVALGQSVTLYHPYRLFNRLRRHDLFQFFSVEHRFDVKTLAHADLLPLVRRLPTGKLGNGLLLLDAMLFGRTAVKRAGRAACDVIYTRDWEVAWCAVRRHLPTVYESHFLPPSLRLRHVIGNMARQAQTRLVVAITSGVEDDLVESGVPREKIVVAPDAVDLRQYQSDPGREAARARLGLDPKRPTAVYTGSLFRYKGVHVVAEAAGALPEVLFLIVGGSPGDIAALRKDVRERGLGNVNVWGSVPPGEVAWFQAAADVLLAAEHLRGAPEHALHVAVEDVRVHGRRQADRRLRPAVAERGARGRSHRIFRKTGRCALTCEGGRAPPDRA